MEGLTPQQLENLFDLLNQHDLQITYMRLPEPSSHFYTNAVALQGEFPLKFLTNFSEIIPDIISMKININSSPYLSTVLAKYATFVWDLKKQFYLGVTTLPLDFTKKMVAVQDNMDFLKLLLLTPMGSAFKNFLIVKPKGALALSASNLEVFLPVHRPDFIYHWLDMHSQNREITIDWLSGLTDDLPPSLQLTMGLPEDFEHTFPKWLDLAKAHSIDDFNIAYKHAIDVLGGRK